MTLASLLLASRPKTLPAAIVPVVAATALVHAEGFEAHIGLSLCAMFGAIFIQIATNFLNDAIDFSKGADTETRLGPQRVTQSGLMTGKQVMVAGALCLLVAAGFGVPLVLTAGWPILLIGLVSLYFAYGYTGGPFPLAYRGLGDLFVILFFGLVAVGGVYFIQTEVLRWSALVLGIQVGCLSTVLIAINNIRDMNQDVLVGKRTFAVRFGLLASRLEVIFLFLLTFCLSVYWVQQGLSSLAYGSMAAIPTASVVAYLVTTRPPGPFYNKLLALSAVTLVLFCIGFVAGALW